MNRLKQVAAITLILVGGSLLLASIDMLIKKIMVDFFIYVPVGAVLLIIGFKMHKPFIEKMHKIDRRKIYDKDIQKHNEHLKAFENQQTQRARHKDDDLRAKLLEREQEKLRKQEKDI